MSPADKVFTTEEDSERQPSDTQTLEAPQEEESVGAEKKSKEERATERMDSFQQYQKQRTEEAIAEQDDSVAKRMSPDYSPPNTVRGTEGDNANFRPDRTAAAVNPDEEWDPHGGEDEDLPDNYEPAPRPGEEK